MERGSSQGVLQLYLYNLNFLKSHILMQTAYITMQLFFQIDFQEKGPVLRIIYKKKETLRKMR